MIVILLLILANAPPAEVKPDARVRDIHPFNPQWLDGERPNIGDPGFASLKVVGYPPPEALAGQPGGDFEEWMHMGVWVVDQRYQVLGWFEKGKHLPPPFQDWQAAGCRPIDHINHAGSAAIFVNEKSKATLQIDDLSPPVAAGLVPKLRAMVVTKVKLPTTQPAATQPSR